MLCGSGLYHEITTKIAKIIVSPSTGHRSNTSVSDRYRIDADPMVFAIWEVSQTKRCGQKLLHHCWYQTMMTSSNGNIFRVTGPLCGEYTGPGEFPTQRPVTRSFDVFFDLRLNKGLSKQSWGWWFETPSGPLWRQCNVISLLVPDAKPCIYMLSRGALHRVSQLFIHWPPEYIPRFMNTVCA